MDATDYVLLSCDTQVPSHEPIGFRPEPSCGRGTASIIWNCLAVMIFAVWSTIHLNTRTLHSPFWYRSQARYACHLFWSPWRKLSARGKHRNYQGGAEFPGFTSRKVLEAITTIFFPDTAVVVAVEECIAAHYIRSRTRRVPGWKEFSIAQAHLVAMGGIILPDLEVHEDFDQYVLDNHLKFDTFPSPTDISRRAKKERFDKIIAFMQGFYFIVNCGLRYKHRYSLARLEFTTLNYLAYALVVSVFRFRKPQELEDPFFLKGSGMDDVAYTMSNLQGQDPVGNDSTSRFCLWYRHNRLWIFALLYFTLGATGSLNFSLRLPDVTHRTQSNLWKMSLFGIVCVALAPAPYIILWSLRDHKSTLVRRIWSTWVVLLCVGYVLLRLFWLVDSFWYFSKEKADVYATAPSWTQYLGHIGG